MLVGVFGDGEAALVGEDDLLLRGDDVAELFGAEVCVAPSLGLRLVALHHALELLVGHAHHDLAEKGGEAAVGVQRETQVAGLRG